MSQQSKAKGTATAKATAKATATAKIESDEVIVTNGIKSGSLWPVNCIHGFVIYVLGPQPIGL